MVIANRNVTRPLRDHFFAQDTVLLINKLVLQKYKDAGNCII